MNSHPTSIENSAVISSDTPEHCLYKACDEYREYQSRLYTECFGEEIVNLSKSLCLAHGVPLHEIVYAEEGPVLKGIPHNWRGFSPGRLRLAWTFFVQPVKKILEFQRGDNSMWVIGSPL